MGVEIGPCAPGLYPHEVLQCYHFYSKQCSGWEELLFTPPRVTKSINTNQHSNSKPKKREGGELASRDVCFSFLSFSREL